MLATSWQSTVDELPMFSYPDDLNTCRLALLPVDCWRRRHRRRFLSLCSAAGRHNHVAWPPDCSPDLGTIDSSRAVACCQRWCSLLIPAPPGQRDGWLQIPKSILTQSVCLWHGHIWNVVKLASLSYLTWCVPHWWVFQYYSFWDHVIVPQQSL